MKIITDLACELLQKPPYCTDGIIIKKDKNKTVTQIINEEGVKQTGKPIGTYINIECPDDKIIPEITKSLKKLTAAKPRILAVGLGNDRFVADSLGPKVLSYINTNENLMTFEPNVGGITGINSVAAIKAITKLAKPDCVLIIDSLVARDADKIGKNYQIADSGITPGSGIGRDNKRCDKKFLGVPVIAVGVPVCTILKNKDKIMHVVPHQIDIVVKECSLNIAAAVNAMQLKKIIKPPCPYFTS
jgi:spore protease